MKRRKICRMPKQINTTKRLGIDLVANPLSLSARAGCQKEFSVNVPDSVFSRGPVEIGDHISAKWAAIDAQSLRTRQPAIL